MYIYLSLCLYVSVFIWWNEGSLVGLELEMASFPDLKVQVKSLSRVRLCDTMVCSPPDSSVHGIFQARILEWVAISFSRRSSQPRDWTQVYPHCRQTPYRLSHLGSGLQRVRHDRLLLALYWLLSDKQLDPFCFKMMFILHNFYVFFFFFLLYQVLVAASGIFIATCGIFGEALGIFRCGKWDLVPWPGIKPRPPALGVLATGPPGKSVDPPLLTVFGSQHGAAVLSRYLAPGWVSLSRATRTMPQDGCEGLLLEAPWPWEMGLGGCSWQLPKPSLSGILPVSPLLGTDCNVHFSCGTETCTWTSWRVPRPVKSTSMHPGYLLFWAPSALWAFCQLLLMCVYHWEPFVSTDCYLVFCHLVLTCVWGLPPVTCLWSKIVD